VKTLNFFGEALCAVLYLWCCRTLARLLRRRGTSPFSPDILIDAGIHEFVIRATLLRYTLKSRHVNVLVCGFLAETVEDRALPAVLNTTPDKGFSIRLGQGAPPKWEIFHSHT
jgi:hypothetical protein